MTKVVMNQPMKFARIQEAVETKRESQVRESLIADGSTEMAIGNAELKAREERFLLGTLAGKILRSDKDEESDRIHSGKGGYAEALAKQLAGTENSYHDYKEKAEKIVDSITRLIDRVVPTLDGITSTATFDKLFHGAEVARVMAIGRDPETDTPAIRDVRIKETRYLLGKLANEVAPLDIKTMKDMRNEYINALDVRMREARKTTRCRARRIFLIT
jgi:hypothetical protein